MSDLLFPMRDATGRSRRADKAQPQTVEMRLRRNEVDRLLFRVGPKAFHALGRADDRESDAQLKDFVGAVIVRPSALVDQNNVQQVGEELAHRGREIRLIGRCPYQLKWTPGTFREFSQ